MEEKVLEQQTKKRLLYRSKATVVLIFWASSPVKFSYKQIVLFPKQYDTPPNNIMGKKYPTLREGDSQSNKRQEPYHNLRYIFSFLWLLAQPFGYPSSRLSDTYRHARNSRHLVTCATAGHKVVRFI